MVLKLKLASPVKFYGNGLPRPRIYSDVKFNDHRVDPPVPVLDPLLSWANEAHWSMGGLSFKRLRLQGRIEGSIGKLRAQREKMEKMEKKKRKLANSSKGSDPDRVNSKRAASDSPPTAPIATKRRRFLDLIDEDVESDDGVDVDEQKHGVAVAKGKRLVKKLADEFDKVAMEGERGNSGSPSPSKDLSDGVEGMASRTRNRRSKVDATAETVLKVVEEVNKLSFKDNNSKGKIQGKENKQTGASNVNGTRTSPRLANRS